MAVLYQELDCLITFVSVHQAIAAERILRSLALRHAALPTPREISVSCGQCLALEQAKLSVALEQLAKDKISWSKIFTRDAVRRIYQEINAKGAEDDVDA